MQRRHILITGERGAGKSHLIRELLRHSPRTPCGFVTELRDMGEEFHPVYLHPCGVPRAYAEQNRVGSCNGRLHRARLEVFDTLGVASLSDLPPNGIVVMDELGFLEAEAGAFTRRVLELLDGDLPVLAAVKDRPDVPFLRAVCAHPNAALYRLTVQNRQTLLDTLLPLVRG